MITYIYFIQQGNGSIKIGLSNDPSKRLLQLQTGNAKPLKIIAALPFQSRKEAQIIEGDLHRFLEKYKMRGEWFNRKMLRHKVMKEVFGGSLSHPQSKLACPDTT